jgi:hypothetical protein
LPVKSTLPRFIPARSLPVGASSWGAFAIRFPRAQSATDRAAFAVKADSRTTVQTCTLYSS